MIPVARQRGLCVLKELGVRGWGGVSIYWILKMHVAVKPPSLLLMELPVLLGPSTGPNPLKSTLFANVVTFHQNVPASSQRIPFDTIMIRFRDLNARHTSMSVDVC